MRPLELYTPPHGNTFHVSLVDAAGHTAALRTRTPQVDEPLFWRINITTISSSVFATIYHFKVVSIILSGDGIVILGMT